MKILFSSLRDGWREIIYHPVRSFITMIGLVFGVASLIAMMGLVQGLIADWKAYIIESGGLEKVAILQERPPKTQQHLTAISPGRTPRDGQLILRNVPGVSHVSPEYALHQWGGSTVYRGRQRSRNLMVMGVNPAILAVNRHVVESGRFVTAIDSERGRQVAVIGSAVRRDLFPPNEDPIGQLIHVRGQPFRVIGILKHYEFKQGGINVVAQKNRRVHIPLQTALKRFAGDQKLTWLNFRIGDTANLSGILGGVQNVMRFSHRGVVDFRFKTQEERVDGYYEAERRLQSSIGGISAISLFIGGIVVMNIMLASAKERVREIGVRKAIGAQHRDIFLQMMSESLIIGIVGGLLGMASGVGLIETLKWLLPDQPPPIVLPSALMLGFVASVVTAFLAGLYPAFTAARLNPLDALQYE